MNVKRASSLPSLAAVYVAAGRIGVEMQSSELGFMLTRANTENADLRRELLAAVDNDGARCLIQHAWGCGDECRGGLHIGNC